MLVFASTYILDTAICPPKKSLVHFFQMSWTSIVNHMADFRLKTKYKILPVLQQDKQNK